MRLAPTILLALAAVFPAAAHAQPYPGFGGDRPMPYGYPQGGYPQEGYAQGGYAQVPSYGGYMPPPRRYADPRSAYTDDSSLARRAQHAAAVSGGASSWDNPRTGNSGSAHAIGYPHPGQDYGTTCRGVEEEVSVNGMLHRNRGTVCLPDEAFRRY